MEYILCIWLTLYFLCSPNSCDGKKQPNKLMHLIIYHGEFKQHHTGKWRRMATAMMTTAAFLVFIDRITSCIRASMMPIVYFQVINLTVLQAFFLSIFLINSGSSVIFLCSFFLEVIMTFQKICVVFKC